MNPHKPELHDEFVQVISFTNEFILYSTIHLLNNYAVILLLILSLKMVDCSCGCVS